jgi:hypothetical protein
MTTRRTLTLGLRIGPAACVLCLLVYAAPLHAQGTKKNPRSKVYFSDVNGEAQIDTGEMIEDLSKRSVYSAEGAVIETKGVKGSGDSRNYSTMVYSNGTGAFFDANTRVEVKQFSQDAFTPNRTDMEVEPSVSHTQAFVARGTVGLCASKLVAGSTMNYQTPLASINVRGPKVVIEAMDDVTKISMLEGESTVRAGSNDLGGQTVRSGEQAIIRRRPGGAPPAIQIIRIPPQEAPALDGQVAMACMAKKTVYFEVRERPATIAEKAAEAAADDSAKKKSSDEAAATDGTAANGGAAGSGDSPAVAASTASSTSPANKAPSGEVTAFYGNSSSSASASGSSSTNNNVVREIIPVPVVPANLPVNFTISPAALPGRTGPGG